MFFPYAIVLTLIVSVVAIIKFEKSIIGWIGAFAIVGSLGLGGGLDASYDKVNGFQHAGWITPPNRNKNTNIAYCPTIIDAPSVASLN